LGDLTAGVETVGENDFGFIEFHVYLMFRE
jgi:hypothetical protein